MKQLVICSSFPYSTHTFVTREIAETLARGHDVVILAPDDGDSQGQELAKKLGIGAERIIYLNVLESPVVSTSLIRFTSRVRKAGQKEIYGRKLAEKRKSYFSELLKNPLLQNVELIHAHFSGWAYEVAMPLSELLQVPFTFTVHDSMLDKFPEYYFRHLQEKASGITFPSKNFLGLWSEYSRCKDHLYILPNAVAIDDFSNKHEYRYGDVIRIISVGRLSITKRFCDGLHATRLLINHGVECHYTIIGSGPERDALHKLARDLDIEPHVSFLGNQSHERVISELGKSDIFIHPSENESFGVAVIEAMAAGLPVVAALNGGTQETVVHGETGLLYSPGDINALLQGLLKLSKDADLRESWGIAGRERVESIYTWDSHMTRLFEIWQDALSRKTI